MANERKAIGKRLRFSIFERDDFTCQYCGKTPPEVKLHIDHIIPVCKGGTNDPSNLRTSCEACNLGKGAGNGKQIVSDIGSRRRAQEALESVELNKIFKKAKAARDSIHQEAVNLVCEHTGDSKCNRASATSIVMAIEEFGPDNAIKWLDRANRAVGKGNYPNETQMIRYFCGILRNKREEQ